jgi:HEPN domain-containing protein
LALARSFRSQDVLVEDLCFHAQQAVEKSMKAVLLHRGIPFPYTHDIARLVTLLKEAQILWPDELDEAAGLTAYAVEARYPGLETEVSEDEHRLALDIAARVLAWAEDFIATSPD